MSPYYRAILGRLEGRGWMTPGELATRATGSRSNLSLRLRRLVARGLVGKRPAWQGSKRYRYALSAAGRRALGER